MRRAGPTVHPPELSAHEDAAVPTLEAFERGFEEAASACGGVEERFVGIGPLTLRVAFAGETLVPIFWQAFEPFEVPRPEGAGNWPQILVWESERSGVPAPELTWRRLNDDGDGYMARYAGSEVLALQEYGHPAFTIAHPGRGTAVHHVTAAADVTWLERGASLRFALFCLLGPHGLSLIHSAAVGVEGRGALLAGPSGSGKSTLSLACLRAGMQWTGDDYVALELTGEGPVVHALHGTTKLSAESVGSLDAEDEVISSGQAPEEKLVLSLEPDAARLLRSVQAAVIVIPRLGFERPRLRETSAAEAYRALAPSTMVQPSSRGRATATAIAALVREVPSRILELGPEHAGNAAAVRELVDGLR